MIRVQPITKTIPPGPRMNLKNGPLLNFFKARSCGFSSPTAGFTRHFQLVPLHEHIKRQKPQHIPAPQHLPGAWYAQHAVVHASGPAKNLSYTTSADAKNVTQKIQ